MSPKFLLAYIYALPIESAFMAEVRGGQKFRGWDQNRYLLASISNSIRILAYMFLLANRDPKKQAPKAPEPYPLPDKEAKQKRQEKPGSFAYIAKAHLAAAKKHREGGGV